MSVIRIIIIIALIGLIFYLYKNQSAPLNIEKSISESILNSLSNTPFTNSFPSSSSYSISR